VPSFAKRRRRDVMTSSGSGEDAQFIYNTMRLKTFPVGVRFLKNQKDLPENARRPKAFLGKKITICQAMTMARNYGWMMGITGEDIICVLASLAFGFTDSPEPRQEMTESFFESGYKIDMDKTRMEVDQMCFLDTHAYEALLMGPLHKMTGTVDTVVLYGNPAQISRLAQAATFDTERKIQGLFGGKVECPEYLIRPMITGEPRVVIPGPGDRVFSMTADDEMIFAFPYSFLDRLIVGLKEAGKKAGARYPITVYQNFQPEFPKHYQERGKKLGI
jgi:uncharacterized protein (DUF169 family)